MSRSIGAAGQPAMLYLAGLHAQYHEMHSTQLAGRLYEATSTTLRVVDT